MKEEIEEQFTPQDEIVVRSGEEAEGHSQEEGDMDIKCSDCGKMFETRRLLKKHETNVHQPRVCYVCSFTFSNEKNLKRHIKEVHKKEQKYQCGTCGHFFSRETSVKIHEESCGKEKKRMKKRSFILQKNERLKGKKKTFQQSACRICVMNFVSRTNLLRHMKKKHGGCQDQGFKDAANTFTKNTEEIGKKKPTCSNCATSFDCVRDLKKHKETDHAGESIYPCDICTKFYQSSIALKAHKRTKHMEKSFDCYICDKKFHYKHVLQKHIKTHTEHKQRTRRKRFEQMGRTQKNKIINKEGAKIESKINKYPDQAQKVIWKNLIKTNPSIIDDINSNPLTNKDIIDIIQETNIAEEKIMKILMKLRKKWGRKVITPNVKKALKERKNLMASFFTLEYIDENSEKCFKDKEGNVQPRWLVYCHDLEGLIDLKVMILEENNLDPPSDLTEVAGLDGGKGKLMLCYSWSSMTNRNMKGPKQCLVLALVASVEENVENLRILFEKTKLNQQDIVLAGDLKVINILCGMQNHRAKHPCPYGECTKNLETGRWTKGRDRTTANLAENQKNWLEKTGGGNSKKARDQLMNFKNVEHHPVLNPGRILELAPPPGSNRHKTSK